MERFLNVWTNFTSLSKEDARNTERHVQVNGNKTVQIFPIGT